MNDGDQTVTVGNGDTAEALNEHGASNSADADSKKLDQVPKTSLLQQHFRQRSSVSSITSSSSGSDRSGRNSSLELIHDDSSLQSSGESRASHRHGHSHQLSVSSTPNSRKRLSLNFTPLPVIGSNSRTSNASAARESRELERDTKMDTVGSQTVNNTSLSPLGDNKARANSATSSSSASTVETYLSELASKERKVVELRDEQKRVQEALRKAEIDLRRFREEASHALASPGRAAKAPAQQHSNSSPADRSKRKSLMLGQRATSPNFGAVSLLPNATTTTGAPFVAHPTSSTSPTLSPTTRRPRAQYSFEEDRDHNINTEPYDTGNDGSELSSKDYLNIGKRVVEELGTQFWGLFEDIKNVTIGEEARDASPEQVRNERTNDNPGHHQNPQPSRYRTNSTTPHTRGSNSQSTVTRRQRSASNSYYIL
jgi:hypothetical protein